MATSCKELTHWKSLWCWEGLGAGGEGDDRGWDGWMASPTRWMWVWVNSGRWWWTERPGVLRFMGPQSQTWLSNWTELKYHSVGLLYQCLTIAHLRNDEKSSQDNVYSYLNWDSYSSKFADFLYLPQCFIFVPYNLPWDDVILRTYLKSLWGRIFIIICFWVLFPSKVLFKMLAWLSQ